MGFNPFIKHFPIISPYQEQDLRLPNWRERINKVLKLQSVNVILIDGRTQSGKTMLGQYIAKEYDPDFKTFFTVQEIINYFKKFENNRWILLEEPQLEANRLRFWDERNLIMSMFISAFGFTKNSLIMTLPNIKGISDMLLTNISMRITVISDLDKGDKIKRIAFIKKPIYNARRDKYIWTTVENYPIPELQVDQDYLIRKKANFGMKLNEWDKRLNIGQDCNPFMLHNQ
jgi:hypothetical protein